MVIRDPFKGESWPPTFGDKKVTAGSSPGRSFFLLFPVGFLQKSSLWQFFSVLLTQSIPTNPLGDGMRKTTYLTMLEPPQYCKYRHNSIPLLVVIPCNVIIFNSNASFLGEKNSKFINPTSGIIWGPQTHSHRNWIDRHCAHLVGRRLLSNEGPVLLGPNSKGFNVETVQWSRHSRNPTWMSRDGS